MRHYNKIVGAQTMEDDACDIMHAVGTEVQADCMCIVYPGVCVLYRAEEVQADCMCIVYPDVCVL